MVPAARHLESVVTSVFPITNLKIQGFSPHNAEQIVITSFWKYQILKAKYKKKGKVYYPLKLRYLKKTHFIKAKLLLAKKKGY